MKQKLSVAFGMILATSAIGARGLSCGPCGGGQTTEQVPVLPMSTDGGSFVDAGIESECDRLCPGASSCYASTIEAGDGGIPSLSCTNENSCGGAGRRPLGHDAEEPRSLDSAAAWLAHTAWLEALSVGAFRDLRADLAAHGAPASLLRRASRAARDERRHARAMTSLARRRGAVTLAMPSCDRAPARSLEEIATTNAVEGCVRETFAALIAHAQARAARSLDVRAAMSRIARDETRHAELSRAIDAWATAKLDAAARARVDAARRRAIDEILESPSASLSPSEALAIGLPDACLAGALARALFAPVVACMRSSRVDATLIAA